MMLICTSKYQEICLAYVVVMGHFEIQIALTCNGLGTERKRIKSKIEPVSPPTYASHENH